MDHVQTRRVLITLLLHFCYTCYVHAFPRATTILRNNERNLPSSNVQVHYNITSIGSGDRVSIYDDYDSPSKIPPKRPRVCNDCVCGIGRRPKIVGGSETSVYEYPWLVSLSRDGQYQCVGSLITRRHVLTAAHCLIGTNPSRLKIVLADSYRFNHSSIAVERRVRSYKIHENYQSYTYDNDIGIIEMDRPVSLDAIIRTGCLPGDEAIDYSGATAVAVGWGMTGEEKPLSDTLRKVNLPILSQEECDQTGYQKNRITDNMFCAGFLKGQRDACRGDSGGPLHVQTSSGHSEIIGIISWGRGCARPNFPGIYTKMTNYLGWLKDHLDGECTCQPPAFY